MWWWSVRLWVGLVWLPCLWSSWNPVVLGMRVATTRILRVDAASYEYDSHSTYCWELSAGAFDNDANDGSVIREAMGSQCPLTLALEIGSEPAYTNEFIAVTWTVTITEPGTSDMLFRVSEMPSLMNRATKERATIIHSSAQTCQDSAHCIPFVLEDASNAFTTNQIGNVSAKGTPFSSKDLVLEQAGEYVVFAHVVVPGNDPDSRYDFAVFTTLTVEDRTQAHLIEDKPVESSDANTDVVSSSASKLSTDQIAIVSAAAVLFLVLALALFAVAKRNRRERKCGGAKRTLSDDPMSTMQSDLGMLQDIRTRSRSSDWSELYAVEDHLPPSILVDDSNTIAILRASHATTPSPSHGRMIADFRHDIARWDIRSSGSPITPSSSAILGGCRSPEDLDSMMYTPVTDCFVPLESIAPDTPRQAIAPGSEASLFNHNVRVKRPAQIWKHRKDADEMHEVDV